MTVDWQQLKDHLLQTDHRFRLLAEQHQELDGRLQQLENQSSLSGQERVEEVNLKKRKLQLKDRMQDMMRHRGDPQTA